MANGVIESAVFISSLLCGLGHLVPPMLFSLSSLRGEETAQDVLRTKGWVRGGGSVLARVLNTDTSQAEHQQERGSAFICIIAFFFKPYILFYLSWPSEGLWICDLLLQLQFGFWLYGCVTLSSLQTTVDVKATFPLIITFETYCLCNL